MRSKLYFNDLDIYAISASRRQITPTNKNPICQKYNSWLVQECNGKRQVPPKQRYSHCPPLRNPSAMDVPTAVKSNPTIRERTIPALLSLGRTIVAIDF
ncbi:MAG: hypothetical protein AABY00_01965 [Nanoarchaeota archaeon]